MTSLYDCEVKMLLLKQGLPNNMRAPSVKLESCLCNYESPRIELWILKNQAMELHQSILDVYNWGMEIHESLMDFHNWFMKLHNSKRIMELYNWFADLHNSLKEPYKIFMMVAWSVERRNSTRIMELIIDLCSPIVVPWSSIIGWGCSIMELWSPINR